MKINTKYKGFQRHLLTTLLSICLTILSISCDSSDDSTPQAPSAPQDYNVSSDVKTALNSLGCQLFSAYLICEDIKNLQPEHIHSPSPIQVLEHQINLATQRAESIKNLQKELSDNKDKSWSEVSTHNIKKLQIETDSLAKTNLNTLNELKNELIKEDNYQVVNGYKCDGNYKSSIDSEIYEVQDSILFSEVKDDESSFEKKIQDDVIFSLKSDLFRLYLGDYLDQNSNYKNTEKITIINDTDFNIKTEIDFYKNLTHISCQKDRKQDFDGHRKLDRLINERAYFECQSVSHNRQFEDDKMAFSIGTYSLNMGREDVDKNIFNQLQIDFGHSLNKIVTDAGFNYYGDLSVENGSITMSVRLADSNKLVAEMKTYNTARNIVLSYEKNGEGALITCKKTSY